MQPKLLLLFACLASTSTWAQVNEDFSDSDLTTAPIWIGNTADWMVNSNLQLQSNNTVANSTFYLSTASTLATEAQWEFWVRLNFNTSSANYVDVYLTASSANLTLNSTTGYFVRIGNTQDEVSLYRKDANGTSTRIIDGMDGTTNTGDNVLKIKVVRNAASQFILFRDASGTGNNYISEGTAVDATFSTSSFFGILVRQSTSSFFQRHFFDDVEVRPYVPDQNPPTLLSLSATSATTLDVLFSEPVDISSAQNTANYTANNNLGNPSTATRSSFNAALVQLSFTQPFSNGLINTLTVNGVNDLSGNTLINGNGTFSFYTPQAYDVVIDEIMADPTPQVALPNAEFIELKNVSSKTINLQGWRIASSSATSAPFPPFQLPPDSFLIITTNSSVPLFTSFGKVLGVSSFPSLPNDGTTLTLTSKEGKIIHAVAYDASWYGSSLKAEGGWTLEMIDTNNPCTGSSNWKASTHPSGGTPATKNAVDAINNDVSPPRLVRTYATDSVTIVALFDEPLDSLKAGTAPNYTITNGISIISATAEAPLFNAVVLKLSAPLQKQTVYHLSVTNVQDCKGNVISSYNKAMAGRSEEALPGDLIINEMLFNPRPGGYDYVELYNRSKKIIDASSLYIANKNSSGVVANFQKCSAQPFFIFPGEYLVLTEDLNVLMRDYNVGNSLQALKASLPSYPDDKGTVVLTDFSGSIIDEVNYSEKWHFKLISNNEGVALERVDPAGPSQAETNWTSAAATAGYGTPTAKNSQFIQREKSNATVEVFPKVFSPDNDGNDDLTAISYQLAAPGYVANVYIHDANGRMVRYLVKNAVLGSKGMWTWDGLDEKGQKLTVGTYIVYTELFNLQGKKEYFKNVVVLARRL